LAISIASIATPFPFPDSFPSVSSATCSAPSSGIKWRARSLRSPAIPRPVPQSSPNSIRNPLISSLIPLISNKILPITSVNPDSDSGLGISFDPLATGLSTSFPFPAATLLFFGGPGSDFSDDSPSILQGFFCLLQKSHAAACLDLRPSLLQ